MVYFPVASVTPYKLESFSKKTVIPLKSPPREKRISEDVLIEV